MPKIYAFNSYDVNRVGQGNNTWMMGANTFGLELPADGVPFRVHRNPEGQASTSSFALWNTPAMFWVALSPAGAGFWFEITAKVNPTVGTRNWGDAYRVIAHYNGPAAG